MNNPTLNAALSELEQNLKKLDSARNQVENVSNKTNEIIKVVSHLTSSIEKLKNSYEAEEKNLKQVYAKISDDLKINFKSNIDKSKHITDEYQKLQQEHSRTIKSSIENLNKSLQEASRKLEEIDVEKSYNSIKEILDEQSIKIDARLDIINNDTKDVKKILNNHISFFNSFETNLMEFQRTISSKQEDLSNLFNTNRSEANKKLAELILSTDSVKDLITENSVEYKNRIDKLVTTITTKLDGLDKVIRNLAAQFENLQNKTEKNLERIEKNQNRNFQILIAGIVLVALILLIK